MKYLLVFGLIIFSTHTFALGKLGHQLVCDLAYQQLTTDNQQKVDELLNSLSQKDKQVINKYNYADEKSSITLGKACTWPDAVKKEPQYKKFGSWHYINIARNIDEVTADTCQKNCITQAVNLHKQQLKTATNNKDKTQALMFLGHWIGDIHQPMHVSFASDLGGNKTAIEAQGEKCDNIHWLWDDCLISRQSKHWKLTDKYQQLFPTLADISHKKLNKWQQGDVFDWANESLNLARANDTKYCQLNGNSCNENAEVVKFDLQELDKLSKIINIRMQQASVRLATLLAQNL